MAFIVEKEVKLDDLGPGWSGASIVLNALSFRESEQLADLEVDADNANSQSNKESYRVVTDLLAKKFVRGKAFDGEGLVDLKAEELVDLPVEIVNSLIKALVGTVSPN